MATTYTPDGRAILVDPESIPRLQGYRVRMDNGYPLVRKGTFRVSLIRFLFVVPPGCLTRWRNGNRRDCRTQNIEFVKISKPARSCLDPNKAAQIIRERWGAWGLAEVAGKETTQECRF